MRNVSEEKITFKTWTWHTNDLFSEYRNTTIQQSWLFSCPCYLPQGQLEDLFWVCLPFLYILIPREKPHFPLQRGGSPGLGKPRVLYPSLDSVILIIMSIHFAWLPSVSVQQHLISAWGGLWGPYIYIYNHEYLPQCSVQTEKDLEGNTSRC